LHAQAYRRRVAPIIVSTVLSTAASSQLDARELRAWRGLLRAHASLVKALDAELDAEHGLPLVSYEVLLYLDGADGQRMRMCDLASSIRLSRSGLTRLVDRLERDGLIERVSCLHDARGSYATLTPAGRAKLLAASATHLVSVRRHFLDYFEPDELVLLGEYWDRVVPGYC
jgi:DNA-binding MarR family transcriptional regulator